MTSIKFSSLTKCGQMKLDKFSFISNQILHLLSFPFAYSVTFVIFSFHQMPASFGQHVCAVNNFETQTNFDPLLLEGDWYVNKRSSLSPFSNPFSSEKDTNLNFRFIPQEGGRIDSYISYYMKFLGLGFCNKQKVYLDEEEEGGISAKRIFKSQGILSSFAELGGLTHLWVLSTDYSSYIIFFSCTIDVSVTECPEDHAQLFILSKLPRIDSSTQQTVDDILRKNQCFDAFYSYTIEETQDNKCPFVEPGDAFAEISLPGIYLISVVAAVVLFGLLIVCCCCCCGNDS